MPHFSADILDALLDGDPGELEAMRALLGAGSASGTGCRQAPLPLPPLALPPLPLPPLPLPVLPAPADQVRPPAVTARATKRRPGPVSRMPGRRISRPPMPG